MSAKQKILLRLSVLCVCVPNVHADWHRVVAVIVHRILRHGILGDDLLDKCPTQPNAVRPHFVLDAIGDPFLALRARRRASARILHCHVALR